MSSCVVVQLRCLKRENPDAITAITAIIAIIAGIVSHPYERYKNGGEAPEQLHSHTGIRLRRSTSGVRYAVNGGRGVAPTRT